MTLAAELDDPCRAALPGALQPAYDAGLRAAVRSLGPQGLADYRAGARALAGLGRGEAPVLAWLEAMPEVGRELGDELVADSAAAALKLASMTSGEVIALHLASLPVAARRLADAELFRAYLQFIHQLASCAPRALRPMLGILDELLARLTLGGLRRWAAFGAEAHRTDLPAQLAYFALQTADSQAVLQRERRGVLFIDRQRTLAATLRALWGRDFWLRPAAAELEGFRPWIDGFVLHLPDAADALGGLDGGAVYQAMAAHMAAHLVYTPRAVNPRGLAPAQKALIGLFEDARVEWCALRELPGLARLWRPLLALPRPVPAEHPAQTVLEALARHLSDPQAPTGDAQIDALAARFHAQAGARALDVELSRELGLQLHALLQGRGALPALRQLEALYLPYRDDNRYPWAVEDFSWQRGADILAGRPPLRRRMPLTAFLNEVEVETAGDDAQEIWTPEHDIVDDDGISFGQKYGREAPPEPHLYPEWDYRVQLHRPDWVTVYEPRPPLGDPAGLDALLARYRGEAARLRRIVERLRPQGVVRQRKLEDGDELDLNAAVDAAVAMRSGQPADTRVTMRHVVQRRDVAVLVLLDLSASTNDPAAGGGDTVLALTRAAAALLAGAVHAVGDAFALHGFCSDGRHDVRYHRIKDFAAPLDDSVRARLAGLRGEFSTRMGAALRHAGRHLARQPQRRRLLLVVTDGEPADIDERDPQYLRQDARKAVDELRAQGVHAFCLTLDPRADQYVARIFGASGYAVVDRVERLPEKLPALFASLTG